MQTFKLVTKKECQCSKLSMCKHFNTNRNKKNIKKQRRCSKLSVCKHFSKNVIKIKKEHLNISNFGNNETANKTSNIFSNETMTYKIFFIIC
jgi:hypothetical protein